jgi:hypothetical protein
MSLGVRLRLLAAVAAVFAGVIAWVLVLLLLGGKI